MRPLTRSEIVDLPTYERRRIEFRDRIIALKRTRRLAVGDRVSLLFENRETVRFQVQEMLRIERIADPSKVQQELDIYNELIPVENELSATLLIEITERERIKLELDRLVGLDEHVCLVLGREGGEERIAARFDPKQFEAERISAVQYIKFPLAPSQIARLRDGAVHARIRIDHPNYTHEAEIPSPVRESLLGDLAGDPPSFLEGGPIPARPPS